MHLENVLDPICRLLLQVETSIEISKYHSSNSKDVERNTRKSQKPDNSEKVIGVQKARSSKY